MKSAKLTASERHHVLVQTRTSTHYHAVRHALRTLLSDDLDRGSQPVAKAWHADEWEPEEDWDEHGWDDYAWWTDWSDDGHSYWNEWDDWVEDSGYEWADAEEVQPDETSEAPEEKQLQEAFAIAGEANRTLQQARDAVKRVRTARGYYSPESTTGKGMSPSKLGSSSGKGKGKPQGKRPFGPCFICGKPDHGYAQCPDRFSKGGFKGKGKGKSKGFGKGKGKGKSGKKGKNMFLEHFVHVNWDDDALMSRCATRATIDTGATANAVGVDCLDKLVSEGGFNYSVSHEELPIFKFGNGERAPAISRVNLYNTALGDLPFYVLGAQGSTSPPLLGAKTLRQKRALVSYGNGMFVYSIANPEGVSHEVQAVRMGPLTTGHLTLDLADLAERVSEGSELGQMWFLHSRATEAWSEHGGETPKVSEHVLVMSCMESDGFQERAHVLATLAQKLSTFHAVLAWREGVPQHATILATRAIRASPSTRRGSAEPTSSQLG